MTEFGRRELSELGTLVRAVARTEVMPRLRKLGTGAVREKTGPLDLVTDADEAAEVMLAQGLRRSFPGCAVIGEEAASAEPGLLGQIAGAGLAFIVDPIDGTANYAAGLPLFGMMIAVTRHSETVASLIHDPVGDDTAYAWLGGGAWLETADGTDTPLRVGREMPLGAMTAMVSWRFMPEPRRSFVCRNLPRLAAAWDLRCAAHHYRMAAAGHCHALIYERLMPWDHAAGVLLHSEAGGYSARLDGTPYSPAETQGGLICAPSEAAWQALRAGLFG